MTDDRVARVAGVGLVLGIILLSVPLAAHAYVGSFSRFMGDDYCDASTFRREGLVGAQKYFYNTWGAVPTTILLMAAVDPGGPALAPWLPGIALAVWVVTLAWAFAQFTRGLGIRHPGLLALGLAEAVVFATVEDAPNIVQSLYLRIPMLAYVCPVIALGGYVGFCRQSLGGPPSRGRLLASAIVAFVAGSFGPVYVAMQTTAIAVALAMSRTTDGTRVKRSLSPVLAAGLAGSIAALAFIAVAPGNTKRAAFFPPKPPLTYVVRSTALATMFMMARPALPVLEPAVIAAVPRMLPDATRWLDRALAMGTSPVVPLLVMLLGGLVAMAVPRSPFEGAAARRAPMWLIALPGVAFVVVAAAIAVGPFGTSAPPPPRALIMPQFVLEALALAWGFLAGAAVRHGVETRNIVSSRALVLPLTAMVLMLAAVQSARSTRTTLALAPAMRQWAATWDRSDRELRAAARKGRVDAIVPRLDPVGGVGSIGPDPADWVNGCAAQYYGLASVTGR